MHTKKFLATWWTYLALQISAFPPDDLSLLNRSFGTFGEMAAPALGIESTILGTHSLQFNFLTSRTMK